MPCTWQSLALAASAFARRVPSTLATRSKSAGVAAELGAASGPIGNAVLLPANPRSAALSVGDGVTFDRHEGGAAVARCTSERAARPPLG